MTRAMPLLTTPEGRDELLACYRDGLLEDTARLSVTIKGNLWKSFFHLPRMQWYCWQTLASP
jgi:hypothetical protein